MVERNGLPTSEREQPKLEAGKEASVVTGTGEESEWVAVYGREKGDLRLQIKLALDRYFRAIALRSLFH